MRMKLYIRSKINENHQTFYIIDNIKDIIFINKNETQYFQIQFKNGETATFNTAEWYISFKN